MYTITAGQSKNRTGTPWIFSNMASDDPEVDHNQGISIAMIKKGAKSAFRFADSICV